MIKEIRKVGNSNALIIDKPILEMLGIGTGSKVQIRVYGQSLIVTPVDGTPIPRGELELNEEQVLEAYDDVFRRLTE